MIRLASEQTNEMTSRAKDQIRLNDFGNLFNRRIMDQVYTRRRARGHLINILVELLWRTFHLNLINFHYSLEYNLQIVVK